MDDFKAFIEKIKERNSIEDVIDATGAEYKLARKRGNYLRGETHDSLVVRVDEQYYVWNETGERGDVFNWLEARYKWDFWTSLQWLAERAKMDIPRNLHPAEGDSEKRLAARTREDALMIAQRVFARWLREDTEALAYAHDRGWTDETISQAGLGFSGRASAAQVRDMGGEFAMYGIDPDSPAAVAILGYKGDVAAWGRKWEIEVQDNWIEWKLIPGMMSRKRMVYPHFMGGRARYMSARNILGDEINREGREVKAFNLPVALVGARQVYFNHAYGRRAESCVLLEGQADAITLAQWELPAVALAGVSWRDHEELLQDLRERHDTIYIGLDSDEAGMNALRGPDDDWPLAKSLGPMARVLTWPKKSFEDGKEGKDANDLLRWMAANGMEAEAQRVEVKNTLDAAAPAAVAAAGWAGGKRGAGQDKAIKTALEIIAQMEGVMLARYRETLANRLGVGVREFNNMVRAARGEGDKAENGALEIVETLGGYIDGYLVEYLYDEESKQARFAFRTPDGKIEEGEQLDIEGKRYIPKAPNSLITTKAVLFPSKLENPRPTRELVAIVEMFIHQHYLLEDKFFGRLAAYYVLLTWLYDSFNTLPYLRAMGDYGSGKSELMRRIGHVCYRMMSTGGAGTAASLFRALHEYRGTAYLDEMDLSDGGDMANDLIKILNMGAMKGNSIWRLTETLNPDGTRNYEIGGYDVFGPKLIAMRKDFKDQAVSSRCLTVRLMGKEPLELKAAGVKVILDSAFFQQALAIRNLLLRWRLEKWKPEIPISEELMDLAVPARLNQVTMPLKAIAADDPELMKDITRFVRVLNDELILDRSMGLDARVMEALVAIREDAKYGQYRMQGEVGGFGTVIYAYTKDIAKVANKLMDEMNQPEEGEAEGEDPKQRRRGSVTTHSVGKICREVLQLQAKRKNAGFVVIYDDQKLAALKVKYGLTGAEEIEEVNL